MTRLFGNARDTHIEPEQLSAYLDNQATAAERARVEAHLRQCARCQGELESLRQTVVLLQALPRVPVPRAFTLSEAQVGIRRPDARPAWFGGLARGLGAVTAMLMVALVAAALLRQPGWTPGETLARVPQPPAAAPAESFAAPAAVEKSAVEIAPAAEPAALQATEVMGIMEVQTAPEQALALEAPAEPQADVAAAKAAPAAEEPVIEALAMPESAPELSREAAGVSPSAPLGLGGGGAGGPGAAGAVMAAPAAELKAAAAPPRVPAAEVLPTGAGLAYADWQRLMALDAVSDVRELAQATGAQAPVISDGRAWIAYRAQPGAAADLRVVSWDGATQSVLLSEADLGTEQPRGERRILDAQWIPGQNMLAAMVLYYPAGEGAAPTQELWRVSAPGGERRRVLEMGQMGRVFYAPDGGRFAVLEYGTDADPQGSLTLYDAEGGSAQPLLRFPAPPGTPAYPSQLHWLPDGSGLLLAVPGAGDVTLYRAAGGAAQEIGRAAAAQTFWSPDGSRLALVQADGGTLALAAGNGGDPQPYAPLRNGQFLSWSPDGERFLYTDENQVYAGGPGREPELLGNVASVYDPRWVTPDQIVALLDQGSGWMLVWRDLGTGESASLASLPKDITYDFVSP